MRYLDTDAYQRQGIIDLPPGQPGITINNYILQTWSEGGTTIEALHETVPVQNYNRYVALVWLRCQCWQFADNDVTVYGPLLVTQRELTQLQNAEYPLAVPVLAAR